MKHLLLTTIAAVLVGTAFADPIHDAAKSGDFAGVQAELDKGANVNAKREGGSTPLHLAADEGQTEIVELLIAAGADVNVKTDWGMTHWGRTPLHQAAWGGHKEIVELLIAKGADVNAKSAGWETPLDMAEEVFDWHTEEEKAAKKETAALIRKHGGKTVEELFALFEAARTGNIEVAKQAIADGIDVNAKDYRGLTPLHEAAAFGHKEIAELLIAEGADVRAKDDDGNTPLIYATVSGGDYVGWQDTVGEGHKEIAELLIANSADVNVVAGGEFGRLGFAMSGSTPLHLATEWYDIEIAELLIAKGADVNAKDDEGWTPLDVAVFYSETEIADLLREHGGKNGMIHTAAEGDDIEAVKEFLAAGTDVNVKGGWGRTPLHIAAWGGHKEIVELLIAKGADVNAKDEGGETPLHSATTKEVAELLIAKGADVNAKDEGEETPLHSAASGGHKEIVELLIAKGADVNAMDEDGETPLDQAFRTHSLLRKHGGKKGKELKAMMPRLVQHGRFAFSFDATKGKVYEVQDSFDLLNWEVIKTYTGKGETVRFDEERDHDPPQWFYRVRVVE
jgi:cytohesin